MQLEEYLTANELYPKFQSAYRKGHSCETALLKIVIDIQECIAQKKMVALLGTWSVYVLGESYDPLKFRFYVHQ